ncbi:MAG: glycoside hydrolase family 16 protein [Bacteroidia bacterium]|nr:glycoside hydrolase family 16 protein [Bacteroidia bacterium]
MLKKNSKYILFFLVLSSCDDEPLEKIVLPSNLQTVITQSILEEGLVSISATAYDENYFSIYFEDGEETEKVENIEGKASHTYNNPGIYTIRTRAHITPNDYIQKIDTIYIDMESKTDENGIPLHGYSTPATYEGYNLVWSDEFDGNKLNENDWNFEIGTGSNGWGNNESQYYLKENTKVKDGFLTITARQQIYNTNNYTSSRITTQNKQSFKYGRIDIRAALPKGQGLWPALWLLGDNITSVSWPACGEIDIMELVGGTKPGKSDRIIHGTLHWQNNGNHAEYGNGHTLQSGDFSEEFHVFTIIWDDKYIKWYRDDILFSTVDISSLSAFHEKFFAIFNVAVGGNWPGSPDATTKFPQKLHVDYIRVFQEK